MGNEGQYMSINMNEIPPVVREHKPMPHNHLMMFVVIAFAFLFFGSTIFEEANAATKRLTNDIHTIFGQ